MFFSKKCNTACGFLGVWSLFLSILWLMAVKIMGVLRIFVCFAVFFADCKSEQVGV